MTVHTPDLATLVARSARGGVILFFANVLQLLVAIVATMVLARLLTPAEFGLFAMAAAVVALSGPLRDFGLPFAIAHQPQLDASTLDALFHRNAACALMLGAVLLALAPLAAWWFDEPQVALMVALLAVGTLVRALLNVQFGLLTRHMNQTALAFATSGPEILGAGVAVVLAVAGMGVWALLVQQLVALLLQAVMLWFATDWRPRLNGRQLMQALNAGRPVETLHRYARELTMSRVVEENSEQVDRLLIGRLAGVSELGFYQNALRWVTLPLLQILHPFRQVSIARFSRLQVAPVETYREQAAGTFRLVHALVVPVFVLLALEAPRLVAVLLGSQWDAAVPLFRLLAIAMLFQSIDRLCTWIYLGEGRTRARLRWCLFASPVVVLGAVVGVNWGASGVAWAFLITRAALTLPGAWVCLAGSPLQAVDLWGSLWRPVVATLAAVLAVLAVIGSEHWIGPSAGSVPVALFVHITLYAVVYTGVWLLTPSGRGIVGGWLTHLRAPV